MKNNNVQRSNPFLVHVLKKYIVQCFAYCYCISYSKQWTLKLVIYNRFLMDHICLLQGFNYFPVVMYYNSDFFSTVSDKQL